MPRISSLSAIAALLFGLVPGTAMAQSGAVAVPTGLGHDLSPMGMFLQADWVIKGVMLGLIFAVFVASLVGLAKAIEITLVSLEARRVLRVVTGSKSLDDALRALPARAGAAGILVRAAEEEAQLSLDAVDAAGGDGLKERVAARLGRLVGAAGQRLSRGTAVVGTIGSTAPFVGLFGTVWGIMNAFVGIAETQTTNLAVVAPGIAEALLTTAIGLVAAIPSVIIYNMLARAISGYRRLLGDAASATERLVSRDLDFRALAQSSSASHGPVR